MRLMRTLLYLTPWPRCTRPFPLSVDGEGEVRRVSDERG